MLKVIEGIKKHNEKCFKRWTFLREKKGMFLFPWKIVSSLIITNGECKIEYTKNKCEIKHKNKRNFKNREGNTIFQKLFSN